MALEINPRTLGYLNLEGFVTRKEADINHLSQSFVGGGQAGGKISAELIRCGHYASLYNTCKQDLDDTVNSLRGIDTDKYNIIRLMGYDGASKDREIGLRAIQDNSNLLKEKFINDEKIKNSDFTWIVVGLGGGTGNGSVGTISQIVSALMRKEKRYKRRTDASEKVTHEGFATVGVIAAIPDNDSTYMIKLNAALALKEIETLQQKGLIGATLLVDNEKLINDFIEKSQKNSNDTRNIDWVTYGNTTISQLLTEIALLSSLPGTETLDKSEILDIWSTPSFLTIGKTKLDANWLKELKEKHQVEDDQEAINILIKECFNNQNIFAEGFDYTTALKGSLAILSPSRDKIVTTVQSIMMKRALKNALNSPILEKIHYGIFDNNVGGTFKAPKVADEAIIYTMCATKKLPKRIADMTEEAIRLKHSRDEEIKLNNLSTLSSMVGNVSFEDEVASTVDLDLNSILEGNLFQDTENQEEKELTKEEELDKLLGLN